MRNNHYYTEEEKAELMSNPYTLYLTDCKIAFTTAFKRFVISEEKKGTPVRKIFIKAGYRDGMFSDTAMRKRVDRIVKEANSEHGIQEARKPKHMTTPKKRDSARIAELEKQVLKLQQTVDFLKKIRYLEETGHLPPRDSS